MSNNKFIFIISGTTRGIGKFLADYYLNLGHIVIGCARSDASPINHPKFTYYKCNITSEHDVSEMFRDIKRKFSRVDVLINNAGINSTLSLSIMTTLQNARETLNTNVLGCFLLSREGAKLMMLNKFGRIINISSMAVKHEVKGESIYAASKAAVNTMSRVMAKELYPLGITCNVIAPSAVQTSLMEAINKSDLEEILKRNAIPKIGEMSEICTVSDFIIDENNGAFTGQILYLGGA